MKNNSSYTGLVAGRMADNQQSLEAKQSMKKPHQPTDSTVGRPIESSATNVNQSQNFIKSGSINMQIDRDKQSQNGHTTANKPSSPLQQSNNSSQQHKSSQHTKQSQQQSPSQHGSHHSSAFGGGDGQDALNVQLQQQLEALGLGQLQLGQLGKSSSSKIIQIINNYNL